jgi:hypothetical protein
VQLLDRGRLGRVGTDVQDLRLTPFGEALQPKLAQETALCESRRVAAGRRTILGSFASVERFLASPKLESIPGLQRRTSRGIDCPLNKARPREHFSRRFCPCGVPKLGSRRKKSVICRQDVSFGAHRETAFDGRNVRDWMGSGLRRVGTGATL